MKSRGVHAGPESPAEREERLQAAFSESRTRIPYYVDYPPAFRHAPFIDARVVRERWPDFTRRGADAEASDRRRTTERFSSGSTGGGKLRTVVEREVALRRQGYVNVVARGPGLFRPRFIISRPEHLDLVWRRGVASKSGPGWLAVTPGPDPTAVADATWDEVMKLFVNANPESLEGDPAYLSALARLCLAHGARPPRLTRVFAGHSFCFAVYRTPIERAFGIPVCLDYATSELGSIGATCREGRLHLVETGVHFEILARGRAVKEGEVGALVATTLDTRLRPLMRYVTGDVVRYVAERCACGRPYRVIALEGRIANLLPTKRGELASFRDLDEHIRAPEGIEFLRLRETPGALALEIVSAQRREVHRTSLVRPVEELLGRDVTLRFVRSFGIERGKLNAVVTVDRYDEHIGRFVPRAKLRRHTG